MYYTCTAVCCDDLYIETLIHKIRNCLLTFRVFRDDCFSEATPHINQRGERHVSAYSFILDFGRCRGCFSILVRPRLLVGIVGLQSLFFSVWKVGNINFGARPNWKFGWHDTAKTVFFVACDFRLFRAASSWVCFAQLGFLNTVFCRISSLNL